jgi:hypothetical protein
MNRQTKIPRVEIQRESRHPLQVHWPARSSKLLGRIPDAQLARKLGIRLDAVQRERRRQEIEPFRPRRPDIEWTSKMIQLLGTDIDSSVAESLGLPMYCVRHKRQRKGIPPYGDPPEQQHAHSFIWAKNKIALLGSDSDRKVATRLGTNLAVVGRQRTLLGIPSFYPQRRISWTREMTALLGKVTDWKIARKYRMSRGSVARQRRKLGIPPCVETRPVKQTPNLKRILRLPMEVICRHYRVSVEIVARLRRELRVEPLGPWPTRSRRKATLG